MYYDDVEDCDGDYDVAYASDGHHDDSDDCVGYDGYDDYADASN